MEQRGSHTGLSQRRIEGAKTLVSSLIPAHMRGHIAVGGVSKRRGMLRVSLTDLTDVDMRQLCASLRGMQVYVREADPVTGATRVDVYVPDVPRSPLWLAACLIVDVLVLCVCACVIIKLVILR